MLALNLRPAEFFPNFALGWLLGALLLVLVRWLGGHTLTTACQGHTLLALSVPLLLGPGGLAFAALNLSRPRRAALGLGLMLSSLLPGLFVGALDIGRLRTEGCAGGYVVVAEPGGKSLSSVSIKPGQTLNLSGRIGGYTPQTHPGAFTLEGQTDNPGLSIRFSKTSVRVGESFAFTLSASPQLPINTFKAGVQASGQQEGKTVQAAGVFDVQVQP